MSGTSQKQERFESFFQDPLYRRYKNRLYNYLCRRRVLRQTWEGRPPGRILELGCGISPMLDESIRAIRTDLSWRALGYLRKCSAPGPVREVACEGGRLPFTNESLNGIVCSEVLEHIQNDDEVLSEMSRVLDRGGKLLLTCPIHPEYFGFDDKFVGHYRRYRVPDLLESLTAYGFEKFDVRPVLGPLEKQLMIPVVWLFSKTRGAGTSALPLGVGIRALAWIFYPVYVLLNRILAGIASWQVKRLPLQKAVTVCISCRKPK